MIWTHYNCPGPGSKGILSKIIKVEKKTEQEVLKLNKRQGE
jgi:hypothetical protein